MNTKNKLALAGLAAVIAGTCAVYTAFRNKASEERHYYTEQLSLEKLEDKIVILDFWAPWCKPCNALTPYLEYLAKEYKDQVEVIQIATSTKEKDLNNYLKEHKPSLTFVYDRDNKLSRDYNVLGLPTLVRVENGKVISTSLGFMPSWISKIQEELKKKNRK